MRELGSSLLPSGSVELHGLTRIDGIFDRQMLHGAVVPEIFRLDIFFPDHFALFGIIFSVCPFRPFVMIGFSVFLFTGRGPVPPHFRWIDPGKRRNMAALTSHFVRVVVALGMRFVRLICCGRIHR